MSFEPVISAHGLGKCYQLYAKPQDRLKQFLVRGRRQYFREFWALRDVSFDIMPGEVVGIVGRNGAGKSTLLQLVCSTLTPTTGEIAVKGRVAALLELGAGFNPEFSGRENVFMSAAVMGITEQEIAARYEEIVDFSGIRDFIDQPVKTYSSGMYVRLAFAVATSVDPDILVIDEALSVGDGEFARRSFDRIMALKQAGKTILFCSHNTYQIESLCSRAIWLRDGQIVAQGLPADVIVGYNQYLDSLDAPVAFATQPVSAQVANVARIRSINVRADAQDGTSLQISSNKSNVTVGVRFVSDPLRPAPSVAVLIMTEDGRVVASSGTRNDGLEIPRDALGQGGVEIQFPKIPLLKGRYWLHVMLMCEQGIHIYEHATQIAQLDVSQTGLELGVVSLPHHWTLLTPQ